MKHLFSARLVDLLTWQYRVALVTVPLLLGMMFTSLSFTPAAYAHSNGCVTSTGAPCPVLQPAPRLIQSNGAWHHPLPPYRPLLPRSKGPTIGPVPGPKCGIGRAAILERPCPWAQTGEQIAFFSYDESVDIVGHDQHGNPQSGCFNIENPITKPYVVLNRTVYAMNGTLTGWWWKGTATLTYFYSPDCNEPTGCSSCPDVQQPYWTQTINIPPSVSGGTYSVGEKIPGPILDIGADGHSVSVLGQDPAGNMQFICYDNIPSDGGTRSEDPTREGILGGWWWKRGTDVSLTYYSQPNCKGHVDEVQSRVAVPTVPSPQQAPHINDTIDGSFMMTFECLPLQPGKRLSYVGTGCAK